MKKRVILCGPACSGKDYLKDQMKKNQLKVNISYTSRAIRDDQVDGIHYYFISKTLFQQMIQQQQMEEWVIFNGDYYGTSKDSIKSSIVFIKDALGVNNLSNEDRESSYIIFLDVNKLIRINRMQNNRNWNEKQINERIKIDEEQFQGFSQFDEKVIDPYFNTEEIINRVKQIILLTN